MATKKGVKLIRPILISIMTLTIASLIYRNYFSTEQFIDLSISLTTIQLTLLIVGVLIAVGLYFLKARKTP